MNPHQLAKEECANYDGGGCRNIMLMDSLENHVGPRLERCRLLAGEKCRYYEECVLPMLDYITEPQKAKSYLEAKEQYFNIHKLQGMETVTRVCPGCGGELLPRKRYCPSCQIKRRKSTFKNSQNAKRRNGGLGVNS